MQRSTEVHKHKIVYRDPADLRLHPVRKHVPAPDKESPEWLAFIDSVASADGVQTPIFIAGDRVIDGWWRVLAAKQLQLHELPCIERDERDAPLIVAESLIARKTMTRGAAVYLILQMEPEFIEAAEQRRLRNVAKGRKTFEKPLKISNHSNCSSRTVHELCSRLGVHENTYFRARAVIKLFTDHPEARAQFEPQLLNGEKNLWNVLSGWEGKDATKDGKPEGSALNLFKKVAFRDLRRFAAWANLDDEDRETIKANVLRSVSEMDRHEITAAREFFHDMESTLASVETKKGRAA